MVAQSDSERAPKTMLEFLKPGMHIGMQSVDGTTDIHVSIYTPDDYIIAKYVGRLPPFGSGSPPPPDATPAIKKKIMAYTTRLRLPGTRVDPAHHARLQRTTFATVRSVGDDYILVEIDRPSGRRRVVPRFAIGSITLDATPVQFLESGPAQKNSKQQTAK